MRARTARTRSTSSPSPPPSLSFRRRYAAPPPRRDGPCRPGRRARSSTTSAGRSRQAEEAPTPARRAAFPAGRAAPRRAPPSRPARPGSPPSRSPMSSSANGSSPTSPPCSSTKASADCADSLVAVDRRRLAVPGDAVVRDRDLDDVGVVGRLARDDERLGELQADDPGLDVHAGEPTRPESRSTRRTRRRRPRPGPRRARPA